MADGNRGHNTAASNVRIVPHIARSVLRADYDYTTRNVL